MSKYTKSGHLYIITAASLWAIDGVLRRSLFDLPPSTIVFYEHLIGAIILIPLVFRQLKNLKLTQKTWSAVIWVSFFSGVVGTLLFTSALLKVNFIPFSVVFLLQKLQPIFAILAAKLLLKEKLTPKFTRWAILALAAAYFVTFPDGKVSLQQNPQHPRNSHQRNRRNKKNGPAPVITDKPDFDIRILSDLVSTLKPGLSAFGKLKYQNKHHRRQSDRT